MKMDGLSADFIPFSKRPARFPPNGEEGGGGMKRSIILIVNEHSFSSSKLLSYVYVSTSFPIISSSLPLHFCD